MLFHTRSGNYWLCIKRWMSPPPHLRLDPNKFKDIILGSHHTYVQELFVFLTVWKRWLFPWVEKTHDSLKSLINWYTWALTIPCSTLLWCLRWRKFRTACWMMDAALWRWANQHLAALWAVITFCLSSRYHLLCCFALNHRYKTNTMKNYSLLHCHWQILFGKMAFVTAPVCWWQTGFVFWPSARPSGLSELFGSS